MSKILSQPIAYGRTAEIYAWEEGQILKLFYDWFDQENIAYEYHISRAIQKAGLPVPAVGEIIIDWIDTTLGNPLADLARTTIILSGAVACQIENPVEKVIIRIFHGIYLRAYFHLRSGGEGEYRRWLPVVAAARLSEGIAELEDWLIGQVKEGKRR